MKSATQAFEDLGFKNKLNNELQKNFKENLKKKRKIFQNYFTSEQSCNILVKTEK